MTFFGVEGAAEHAFPLYTLADAVRLRAHVLEVWEDADRDRSLVDAGALNVAIVGGGPTGVESAGALAELYRQDFAKDYPGVPPDKARIVLLEAGDDLLGMFRSDIRGLRPPRPGRPGRRGPHRRGGRLGRRRRG